MRHEHVQRATNISLGRFDEGDDDPARDIDVTAYLNDAELGTLHEAMTTGDHALLDIIMDAVEGRASFPDDVTPSEYTSTLKAGGADRNRGGAEKLRRYWTVGIGGAKIRWHTPGDFTRCVEHLGKYLGPRAKGYCALRHKEQNGYWPGSRLNL